MLTTRLPYRPLDAFSAIRSSHIGHIEQLLSQTYGARRFLPASRVRGLNVHANHWQSAVALAKLQERGLLSMPDSLYRDRRLRALVAPKIGTLTVDDIKAALLDDWASPWSICRPPRPSAMSNLSATVITLVMQPAMGLMEIAVLPAIDPSFTSYTLEMDGSASRYG